MAKRFIDTDLFRKPLMRSLQAPYKVLWVYLLCECDHAGVWDVELDVAAMRLGVKLDSEKVLSAFGSAIIPIDDGRKWYLPEFIAFQYGVLNPANRVHASALVTLSKYGIDPNSMKSDGPNKTLVSPLEGAKDKDKDKDKAKEQDKENSAPANSEEAILSRFEKLWIDFGRYGTKNLALKKWKALKDSDRDAVEAAAPEYVASTNTDGTFPSRKYLEGWLTAENRLWERPVIKRDTANSAPPAPMDRNAPITSELFKPLQMP